MADLPVAESKTYTFELARKMLQGLEVPDLHYTADGIRGKVEYRGVLYELALKPKDRTADKEATHDT